MANKEEQAKKTLTPMDIHNKEFKKRGLSGYDRHEVDVFLDQIVDEYGNLLDDNVDLKNEVTRLMSQVNQLQSQVINYQQQEQSIKEQVEEAHKKAAEIVDNATVAANDKAAQAEIDTDYQRQQLETIKSDYERVKREVAGYRSYIQDLLQKAIANLNDDDWQKALDEYFSTERFYPPDGAEPITLVDAEEEVDEDDDKDDEVDNGGDIEVNFEDNIVEDNIDDEKDKVENTDEPKPMEGDSPNSEAISDLTNDSDQLSSPSGTTIIFPDDYKNHN